MQTTNYPRTVPQYPTLRCSSVLGPFTARRDAEARTEWDTTRAGYIAKWGEAYTDAPINGDAPIWGLFDADGEREQLAEWSEPDGAWIVTLDRDDYICTDADQSPEGPPPVELLTAAVHYVRTVMGEDL